jgi:hypothetical protein
MKRPLQIALALVAASVPALSQASSHRETPNIAGLPRVDGTDLYLFRSYEAGRQGFVTMLANYIPFQDPGGGPNFYQLDSTNYPLVRFINLDTNHVFYGRTHDHSSMAVASDHVSSTRFDVPANLESGLSRLEVVANGIASRPEIVYVK